MKKNELPNWVLKYDATGITFRKKGDTYLMIKVSSKRVPDKKYPVLLQEYLGTITEKDGFTPSKEKAKSNDFLLECSLSHFIMANFYDDLLRASFNSNKKLAESKIKAAIILFIYGVITPLTIRLSTISIGCEEEIEKLSLSSINTISNLSKRISNLFKEKITDEVDRINLICLLKQGVVDPRNTDFTSYNEKVLEILKKYGGNFK